MKITLGGALSFTLFWTCLDIRRFAHVYFYDFSVAH